MKRTISTLAAISVLALGLAACQTATPYQPVNPDNALAGGYSDVRLTDNTWRVDFSGNSLTSRETVEHYLLYRAAELTVSQGFDWFVTDDKHTDKNTTTNVDPIYGAGWYPSWRFHRFGGWGGWGGWGGGPWGGPLDAGATITQYDRYEVSANIMMGHGTPPANTHALDAHQVMTNLGPSIVRPKP